MATLFTEDFEGGTNSANVTAGNTAFEWVSSTPPTFSNDNPLSGDLCMSSPVQAYGQAPISGSTVYLRAYLRLATLGTITWLWNLLDTNPSVVAQIRVNNNGTLRIMPGTSGTILESTEALTADEWSRVEWAVVGSNIQLRMFTGANRHGTTPDYDSGPVAWDGATLDYTQIGALSSGGVGVFVDDLAADDTTWVGPSMEPDPEPTETPHWFYDDGSAWVDVTGQVHHDNGATWTAL